MAKMDFGIGLGAELRFDEVAAHARVADESGFSHVTFVDQSNVSREVNGMMTIAALNTRRIQIGHGLCDSLMYHPAVIGNFVASLRELTGGRVFVGLGAGDPFAGKAITRPVGLDAQRETVKFLKKFTAGEDAELWGSTWHSEWIRNTQWAGRPIEVFMGPLGPKSLQMAGEVADQIFVFGAGEPEIMKWNMEQIETGALRVGRDPSEIKVWARTEVYVTRSKEEARHEVSSYAASCANGLARSIFNRDTPEGRDLYQRLERKQPGIVDEFKRIRENFNPYMHESIHAPHAEFATQRVIDFINLSGPVEDIDERIYDLQQIGVHGISCVQYAIIDQQSNMREIANTIMPQFR
ncbi:MAG: LLM class flavin-dependent oxidoreductase [Chloroflexi bacterium]|nr:LLM class flavin-dependent oxidoreductase [Chloroflexota bacterium]